MGIVKFDQTTIGTSSMACDTACDEDWDLSQSKQTNIIIPYNMVEKHVCIYNYIYIICMFESTNQIRGLNQPTGVDWNPTLQPQVINFWKCNQLIDKFQGLVTGSKEIRSLEPLDLGSSWQGMWDDPAVTMALSHQRG